MALRPRSVPRYSVPRAGVGGRLVRERAGDAGTSLVVGERRIAADAQHPIARERVVAETRHELHGAAARDRGVRRADPVTGLLRVGHALRVDPVLRTLGSATNRTDHQHGGQQMRELHQRVFLRRGLSVRKPAARIAA